MFKRTFWATVGYGAGIGSSIYVQRRVRRAVERYTPDHIRREVTATTRRTMSNAAQAGRTVLDAVREGRVAMLETETELRREFPSAPAPRRSRISIERARRHAS